MKNFTICTGCGEQNNPSIKQCHKCLSPLPLLQEQTANNIILMSAKNFFSATFGGIPVQMDLNIYKGIPFQCICENPHNFDIEKTPILRELKGARLVVACPQGLGLVCVKLKGFFKFNGFESLFGTKETQRIEEMSMVDVFEGKFNDVRPSIVLHENLNQKPERFDFDYGKSFYLMDYRERYDEFLQGLDNVEKIICELYLFRAWTTQFILRRALGEKKSKNILHEIVNLSATLGKGVFEKYNNVNFDQAMNSEFIKILEQRWGGYDQVYIDFWSEQDMPTIQICAKGMEYCEIKNPVKLVWLCENFIEHTTAIANELLGK